MDERYWFISPTPNDIVISNWRKFRGNVTNSAWIFPFGRGVWHHRNRICKTNFRSLFLLISFKLHVKRQSYRNCNIILQYPGLDDGGIFRRSLDAVCSKQVEDEGQHLIAVVFNTYFQEVPFLHLQISIKLYAWRCSAYVKITSVHLKFMFGMQWIGLELIKLMHSCGQYFAVTLPPIV